MERVLEESEHLADERSVPDEVRDEATFGRRFSEEAVSQGIRDHRARFFGGVPPEERGAEGVQSRYRAPPGVDSALARARRQTLHQ